MTTNQDFRKIHNFNLESFTSQIPTEPYVGKLLPNTFKGSNEVDIANLKKEVKILKQKVEELINPKLTIIVKPNAEEIDRFRGEVKAL